MNRGKGSIMAVLSLMVVVGVFLLAGVSSAAEKFPSREIVILNNQTAGGLIEMAGRIFNEYFQKEIGVPVLVDSRPEAGGVKALVDASKAKPDGYTLMFNLLPRNAQTEVVYKVPYKLLEFTYLAAFHKHYVLLVVGKDSPYKSLKDLVEASKKKPLNYSLPGMGSLAHLNAMFLKRKAGMDLEVVPFKGGAPSITALLGGHVDLTSSDLATVQMYKDKLRVLAIFAQQRSPKFPDVPTLKELGYDPPFGYTVLGVCGPPHLPEEIQKILSNAMAKAIKNPEFVKKLSEFGPTPGYMSGPEFRAEAEAAFKVSEEYKDILTEQK